MQFRKSIVKNYVCKINDHGRVKIKEDNFNFRYTQILLNEGIKRTNVMYGGRIPDVHNVLFVNGNLDPWHALSILDNLNDASPSIFIKGNQTSVNV